MATKQAQRILTMPLNPLKKEMALIHITSKQGVKEITRGKY
jgi:hypothetical protein